MTRAVLKVAAITAVGSLLYAQMPRKDQSHRSLVGLKIALLLDDEGRASDFRTSVELRLRNNGLPLVEEAATAHLRIFAVGSTDAEHFALALVAEVLQMATLPTGARSVVITWRDVRVVDRPSSFTAELHAMLDRFTNDFLTANPKK